MCWRSRQRLSSAERVGVRVSGERKKISWPHLNIYIGEIDGPSIGTRKTTTMQERIVRPLQVRPMLLVKQPKTMRHTDAMMNAVEVISAEGNRGTRGIEE